MMPLSLLPFLKYGRQPNLASAAVGLLAALLLAVVPNAPAQTPAPVLPTGAQVVQGNASLTQAGQQLQVTNTPGTIINWQSFGIAPGHSTYFQQESANSSVLNRVVTNNPSQIFGTLGSNGRVILVNPSGIVVGAGAVVDTAGFVASTLGLVESNAALSRLRFAAGSQAPGSLQVDGIIRSSRGDIILIAPHAHVSGAGALKAPDGTVMLAAGQQVLLTGRGLDGIALELQAPTDQAINLGRLEGNAVGLFGAQLRNTGVIQANTAELVGGRVMLRAVDTALVSGAITAAGTGVSNSGGVVTVEGRDVLLQSASIDASGTGGGGKVLVGGGWQGKDASMANSQNTSVDAASKINVSGVGNANAGKAVVWSDGNTRYSGQIEARGGAAGGSGGQVEVSGKQNLGFDGMVRVDAPKGVGGSILLDPKNIDFSPSGGTSVAGSVTFGNCGTCTFTIDTFSLQALVNSLAGGSLSFQATNDININDSLGFSPTSGNLNFEAGRSVNIFQPITFGTGNSASLSITANSPNATSTTPFRDAGLGAITFNSTAGITMGGTATTLNLIVGNGSGGGGVVTLGNISNVGTLIVDNQATAGGSTGGIANGASLQDVGGRIFMRTQRGSIGTGASLISVNSPLISVAAASGSAYITSANPLVLGPAPELGGAAANVGGLLYLDSAQSNIGVRGTNVGSGAVTAGQLEFVGGLGSIYSDSPSASGPLVVTVGGITGVPSVQIFNSATVATSVIVGTGGINLGGLLRVDGGLSSNSAAASVTSQGSVTVPALYVTGGAAPASLAVTGATSVLKVLGFGLTTVQIQGGSASNASATVSGTSVLLGSTTGANNLTVLGGVGDSSSAQLLSSSGDISVLGAGTVTVGSVSAGTSSLSKIQATGGAVNVLRGIGFGPIVTLQSGAGSAANAILSAPSGVNIDANTLNLTGASGTTTFATISSSGPINITAFTSLTAGSGSSSRKVIESAGSINVVGPLILSGGSGTGSIALVSTSLNITAAGPVVFDTVNAGTGSHALIYAGGNGVAFTIAGGYTPTLAVNASSTAAALSGVLVPPADIAIAVVLPASALPGSTVSATVTFSNSGLVTATFTPTLVVDGVPTAFAPVTVGPGSTVTSVTIVQLGVGTSTTVAASTGVASWPEINLANNTANAVVLLNTVSDLQVFAFVPASAIAGTSVPVTVTFVNLGPSSNTFTPTVVINGSTTTLPPVTVPAGGTYTTTVNVPYGVSGVTFIAAAQSTSFDPNPSNSSVTAISQSLLSNISTVVSLPSTATVNTVVSGVVTFTNIGSATTTFTPLVGIGSTTVTLAPVLLAPNQSFSTTTLVFVGASGNTLSGGVGANSVPDSNLGNNASASVVTALIPPPPPPTPTPTVTVTVPPPAPTPTVTVTVPPPTPTPTLTVTVPPPTPTPTVTVTVPPPKPTPTETVTVPPPTPIQTPTATVTLPTPTPTVVVPVQAAPVPTLVQPYAASPLQIASLLQQNEAAFTQARSNQPLPAQSEPAAKRQELSDLPICPRE